MPVVVSYVLAQTDGCGAGVVCGVAVRRAAAAPARLLGWALWRFGLRVGSSIWTGGSCDAPGCAAALAATSARSMNFRQRLQAQDSSPIKALPWQ
ncbi:MAG: hypothetical protein WCF75_07950 [Pseudolabrys sp.]